MTDGPAKAARLVEEGLRLYSAGRMDQALRCWQEALRSEPQHQLARQYIDYVETHRRALDQAFGGGGGSGAKGSPGPAARSPTSGAGARRSAPGLPRLRVPPVTVAPPEPEPAFGDGPNYELATDAATPATMAPQRRTAERLLVGASDPAAPLVLDWGADLPTCEVQPHDEAARLAREWVAEVSAGGTPGGRAVAPVAPVAPDAASPVEVARAHVAAGELEAALPILEGIAAQGAGDAASAELLARCRQELVRQYERVLVDLHAVPALQVPPQQVLWQKLDHRAGFILSRVDGVLSYEDILDISGMSHFEACRILAQLVVQGVIAASR
ncbi:MAG: hypothetical protein IPL40_02970 [Proteobacteria bacterium]|nr:hypothetical protein [Pseudomonadota bacterium]